MKALKTENWYQSETNFSWINPSAVIFLHHNQFINSICLPAPNPTRVHWSAHVAPCAPGAACIACHVHKPSDGLRAVRWWRQRATVWLITRQPTCQLLQSHVNTCHRHYTWQIDFSVNALIYTYIKTKGKVHYWFFSISLIFTVKLQFGALLCCVWLFSTKLDVLW